MKVTPIKLSEIRVRDRLRTLDDDWVTALAESIERQGLQNPIQVARKNEDGVYDLIAGAHRYAAYKQLKRDTIPATICRLNQLEQRLLEIDENLFRRELSALDRAGFLAERKAIYEELYPETAAGVAGALGKIRAKNDANSTGSATDNLSFAESVAEKLGLSDRSIRRAISRYHRIIPAVRAQIANTPLANKASELDALGRLEEREQLLVVEAMFREKDPARSVNEAWKIVAGWRPKPQTAKEKQVHRILSAWNRASRPAKKAFVAIIQNQEDWLGLEDDDFEDDE